MQTSQEVQVVLRPQTPQAQNLGVHTRPSNQRQISRFTRTHLIATTCRSKLGKEADRADQQLRLLVCHANMLDMLMDELVDAKRERANQDYARVSVIPVSQSSRRVHWVDRAAHDTQPKPDVKYEQHRVRGSDTGAEFNSFNVAFGTSEARSPPPQPSSGYFDDSDDLSDDSDHEYDDDDDYDDDDWSGFGLERCPSKHCPPDLVSDDGSEDETTAHRPVDDDNVVLLKLRFLSTAAGGISELRNAGVAESPTVIS